MTVLYMIVNLEQNYTDRYVHASVHGDILDLAAGREVIQRLAAITETEAASPILLDVRDIACQLSYASILALVQDMMGEHRGAFSQKIAVLHHQCGKEDNAEFLKLCAGNRGFQVQTFLDEGAAVQWLTGAIEVKDEQS